MKGMRVFAALEFPHVFLPITSSESELKKDNFEVFEEGNQIDNFELIVSSKLSSSVVLVIDVSSSMDSPMGESTKLEEAIEAAKTFVDLTESKDKIGLVSFSDSIIVRSSLTNQKERIKMELDSLSIEGSTRLYDAIIHSSVKLFPKKENNTDIHVMIVLTDGMDNKSIHKDPRDAIRTVKKRNIFLFTIGYGESGDFDEAVLETMAVETDGYYYHAPDRKTLNEIYENIYEIIKNIYTIIYDSPRYADGSVREVLVKIKRENTIISEISRRYTTKLAQQEISWIKEQAPKHKEVGQIPKYESFFLKAHNLTGKVKHLLKKAHNRITKFKLKTSS